MPRIFRCSGILTIMGLVSDAFTSLPTKRPGQSTSDNFKVAQSQVAGAFLGVRDCGTYHEELGQLRQGEGEDAPFCFTRLVMAKGTT